MLMPASPCLARGKGGPALARKREASVRKKVKFDPKKFLAKVGQGKTVSSYRKDQIIFSQGEIADAVFIFSKARSSSPSFRSSRHFGAGQGGGGCNRGSRSFCCEGCLNGHPLRIATTRAVNDDCVITRLEKATMIATIRKEPEFSERSCCIC
jgi:CRP/FNR family cyclic AMP-dependent transcriptional regulator